MRSVEAHQGFGFFVFFLLSKTLDLAFSPLTWAMALVIAGLAIAGRAPARKWLWRSCLTLAVGVLYVFSIQRVSNALERHLEASARSTMKEGVVYDGVVLLGGIVDVLVSEPDRPRAYGANSERLLATYDLLRTGLAKEVVVSSGDGREAHVLRQQLIDWGIAPERVVIEDQSRNTRENAVESARVAREQGWKSILVVTSAFHMERALGCFKAVGLEVDALPVDQRGYDPARLSGSWQSWLPRVWNLAQSTHALHEMAGRVIYRVRGYAQ